MSATIDRSQPLTVTLTAEQWEMVLRMLDEVPAPHRVSDPLIRAIQQQCTAAPRLPTNGADEAPRPRPGVELT
jgi:hypothetical protein